MYEVLCSRLSDPANRLSYQSCLQNAMSIISSLIDYQVENFNQNLHSTTNPFASKVLIKVCIDFLLQHINDVKAPICLRCLTSLAKVIANCSIEAYYESVVGLDYTRTFNLVRNKH